MTRCSLLRYTLAIRPGRHLLHLPHQLRRETRPRVFLKCFKRLSHLNAREKASVGRSRRRVSVRDTRTVENWEEEKQEGKEITQPSPQNKNKKEPPDFSRQLELAARSTLRMLTISEKTKVVKNNPDSLIWERCAALRLQVSAG